MTKRAFVILMTLVLGLAVMLGPVSYTMAQDQEDQGVEEQGSGIGRDLYRKVDEAVSGLDGKSLRRQIREALREMDKMGISPTVIARDLFGIGTAQTSQAGNGKKPGNTLIEDAEKTVRKSTEKFFSGLWNGFLNTLGGLIETGLSVFSGKGGK